MDDGPSTEDVARMRRFAEHYARKTGTALHPDPEVTELVLQGLARNRSELGRPLCPCRFFPDRREEARHRTWLCACDDMKRYKYCHCLLFVRPDGQPITEHLPEDHEGRAAYGLVADPTPESGRESGRYPGRSRVLWKDRCRRTGLSSFFSTWNLNRHRLFS